MPARENPPRHFPDDEVEQRRVIRVAQERGRDKRRRERKRVVVVVVQEHVSLLSSLENTASGTHVELFPRIIREPRIGKRSVARATVSNDETQGGPLHPWVKLTRGVDLSRRRVEADVTRPSCDPYRPVRPSVRFRPTALPPPSARPPPSTCHHVDRPPLVRLYCCYY